MGILKVADEIGHELTLLNLLKGLFDSSEIVIVHVEKGLVLNLLEGIC